MVKLEKLIQDEFGRLSFKGCRMIVPKDLFPIGKMKTIVIENPCLDTSHIIEEMSKEDSPIIPKSANFYLISEFNPDTQSIRNGKMTSVYAVQFYEA